MRTIAIIGNNIVKLSRITLTINIYHSPPCYDCKRPCPTEYPRQRGCNAEEKFSNMVPPSFLCKDANDLKRDRERSRSCGCNIKTRKISANCKCKKKNIDCFAKDRVCEKSCGDGSGSKDGFNNVSEDDNNNNYFGANGVANENANLMCQDASNLPNQFFQSQCANGWGAMPAAGMPTKKGARFDPCTGVECDFSQSDSHSGCDGQHFLSGPCNAPPQPNCMFPCFPNAFCRLPNPMAPNCANFANGGPCSEASNDANGVLQTSECSEQTQNSEDQSKKNR